VTTVAAAAVAAGDGAIARRKRGGAIGAAPTLAREALVVLGLLALGVFLVYHFFVHTIRNPRPLAGANAVVAPQQGTQSEASFAIDPRRPQVIFGALGASGELVGNPGSAGIHYSEDGGRHWRTGAMPAIPGGGCFFAAPRTAIDGRGREYFAFLAGPCSETLTPHLVITSRAGPHAPWQPLTRIAPRVGRWGFDDGPALAVDGRTGRLYLAWTRGLAQSRVVVVVSSSVDRGRTWTPPRSVSDALADPHLASIAVAPDGTVYLAGIDRKIGLWITRSTNGGRSFEAPRTAAPLLLDPARADCALSNDGPLPNELTNCIGPNPTVLVHGPRVYVVYDDIGANRTQDVFVTALARDLTPLFRARVSPPDRGATTQFFPAAAVDPQTGVLSACWYDSTFDPHAHRVWFTCSSSRKGRRWSDPVRAAAKPTKPGNLYGTLPISPAVVAGDGRARAFWPDGRDYRVGIVMLTAAFREP
jgi:hypothetical protein